MLRILRRYKPLWISVPLSPFAAAQLSDQGFVEYLAQEDMVELRLGEQLRPFLTEEDFEAACSEAWLKSDLGILRPAHRVRRPAGRPCRYRDDPLLRFRLPVHAQKFLLERSRAATGAGLL
jgi:hypothetical protein